MAESEHQPPLPPLPRSLAPPLPSVRPLVNIAISVSGGFSPGSPMHTWIAGPSQEYSDPTQTRLVNTFRDILKDPKSANKLSWKPMPDESGYVRIDTSIWIGMPAAPGNWRHLDIPIGWQPTPPYSLDHIGHPRLCGACDYERIIKDMSAQLEELKAKVKAQDEEDRPRKKPRRREPAKPRAETPSGQGTESSRGRGGWGRVKGRGLAKTASPCPPYISSPRLTPLLEDIEADAVSTDLVNTDVANTYIAHTGIVIADVLNTDIATTDLVNTYVHNTGIIHTDILNTDIINTGFVNTDLDNAGLTNTDILNTETPAPQNQSTLPSEGLDSTLGPVPGDNDLPFEEYIKYSTNE
ncbi:hypothetical protein HD806DRAFT_552668 [Xylariaceae sp. AK1471]|nr:hypothetical protein HD806DRAFT_552668 [Xylariaceae sp. AK1471]